MACTESAQRGSILPAGSIKQLHVARTCRCLSIACDESKGGRGVAHPALRERRDDSRPTRQAESFVSERNPDETECNPGDAVLNPGFRFTPSGPRLLLPPHASWQ
jgi:hypothetical protein